APFAVAGMASGLALFWGAAAALYRSVAPDGALRLLVFAGALAGCEWLRGHVLTGFPWDLPGETWRAGSAPSQLASVVGAYGMTWITVAIVAAPGLGARSRNERAALGLAAAALAGLYGFGAWRLAGAQVTPAANAPIIRVVQPDTPELAQYDAAAFADVLKRNLDLTRQPTTKRPDVIVWSEAGLPAALDDYLAPGTWTLAQIQAALQPGQTLITGGYRTQPAPAGAYAPDGVIYHNSLVALSRGVAGLAVTGLYDKHRLVPFGEYLPLDRELAPLGVKQLVHLGQGFTPGPPPRPISPPGVPSVQPLICYESLFPGLTHEAAARAGVRPAWIVNVSDDAWFGVTSGPWQHLNLASYRAIEEGLPMVRATPTGVSAIVDGYGRTLPGKRLGQGAYGVIDAPLPPQLPVTVFAVCGGTLFAAMVLISLASTAPFWLKPNLARQR
ncbi:MAG TPA: apolipoprotein N-acyltransferase, partial [Caulobacteraceae bacterium]|nr:apolipoprotein N-acyltransferase [Caulobacteraceae bacterium]